MPAVGTFEYVLDGGDHFMFCPVGGFVGRVLFSVYAQAAAEPTES